MRVPFKARRNNRSSKVKFLLPDEAVNLKSCAKAVTQVTHSNLGLPTNPPDPRKEVLGKIATSKSFQLTETTNSLALHGMQTSAMQQHAGEEHPPGFLSKQSAIGRVKIAKGAGDRPGEKVGLTHRRESVQEGQADAAIPAKKVEDFSMPENSASDSVTSASLYVKPPPISSSGIYFPSGASSSCAKVQERNLQKISSNSHRHLLSGPALKVIWKHRKPIFTSFSQNQNGGIHVTVHMEANIGNLRGNFEVLDFSCDDRICEGFLAHPSVKISSKAYEFARQIVGVLQFRVHACRAFWPEIFQSDCPDVNDIALYFYPGKIARSRRQYAFLLKLIEKHDLMLRSRIGRMELLVFPSKLLHVDSQKLDGSYFMWGVFHRLKGNKVVYKAEALPCLPTVA